MSEYVYGLFVNGVDDETDPDELVVLPFEGIVAAQSEFANMGYTDVECALVNIKLLQEL